MPYSLTKEFQERFGVTNWRGFCFDKAKSDAYIAELRYSPDDAVLTKMDFPYVRASLPAPIPTPREIAEAVAAGKDLTHGFPLNSTVVHIGPYAVKMGTNRALCQEAENMLYIEKHTDVRAARLYAMFSDNSVSPHGSQYDHFKTIWYYLVQEYIPGTPLGEIWHTLPESRQHEVNARVMQELHRLRAHRLPQDNQYYGRVNDQPVAFACRSVFQGSTGSRKRYLTYSDFLNDAHETMILKCMTTTCLMEFEEDAVEFFENFKETMGKHGQEPRLTHCDLKQHNIIYREIEAAEGDDFEVVFIDWEALTWLPQWAEVPCLKRMNPDNKHLHELMKLEFSPSDIDAGDYLMACRVATAYHIIG